MPRLHREPPKIDGFKLGGLIKDHSPIFVPRWQRDYSWKSDEQVEKLLSDLGDFFDAYQQGDKGYYLLGQIIFVPNQDGDYEIVDGQQRLTTIFLLLLALLNKYRPFISPNMQSRGFTLLEDAVVDDNSKVRLRSPFQDGTAVLQAIYDQRTSDVSALGSLSRTQKNLKEVYETIEDWIQTNLSTPELISSYATLVLDNIYFTRLTIEDISIALDYFEKMNRRGLPLAAADLLKNFLFAQIQDDDDGFEILTTQWQSLMTHLNSVKRSALASPESFIKTIALSKSGSKINGTEKLLDFWKNELKSSDGTQAGINKFRESLDPDGLFYSRAARGLHPTNNNPVAFGKVKYFDFEPIEYFKGVQHLPVLFAARHLENFDYVCDLLNRRFLIYAFARERTGTFESMIPVWSKKLRELPESATPQDILAASKSAENFKLERAEESITNYISSLNYSKSSHHRKLRFALAIVTKYHDIESRAQDSQESLTRYLRTVSRGVPGNDMDHILGQMYFEDASIEEKTVLNSIGALTLVFSSDHREQTLLRPNEKSSMYLESRYIFTKSLCKVSENWAPRLKQQVELIQNHVKPSLEHWNIETVERRTTYIAKTFIEALSLDELY